MTVDLLDDLRTWLYGVVSAAVPVPVYDHIPVDMPPEHVRLDYRLRSVGYKSGETASHGVMVHYFGPSGRAGAGSAGAKRSVEVLQLAHAAIVAASFLNRRLVFDMMEPGSQDDEGLAVHGYLRYGIIL